MFRIIYTPAEWVLNNKNPSPKQGVPPIDRFGSGRSVYTLNIKSFVIFLQKMILITNLFVQIYAENMV